MDKYGEIIEPIGNFEQKAPQQMSGYDQLTIASDNSKRVVRDFGGQTSLGNPFHAGYNQGVQDPYRPNEYSSRINVNRPVQRNEPNNDNPFVSPEHQPPESYAERNDLSNVGHEWIYQSFIKYFGDMDMVKVEDVQNHSIYMALAPSYTSKKHCIYAICPLDYNYPRVHRRLSDLAWVNFQTRSLEIEPTVQPQEYPKVADHIMGSSISQISDSNQPTHNLPKRTDAAGRVKYRGKLPLLVELLEDKSNAYGYSVNGKLYTALETWNCIVTFV